MIFNSSFLSFSYKLINSNKFIFKIFRKCFVSSLNLYLFLTDKVTFKSLRPNQKNIEKKRIHFYTIVWGDYLKWFLKYNLPSVLQPGNVPKIFLDGYEVHLYIYTSKKDKDFLNQDNKATNILNNFSNYGQIHISSFKESNFKDRISFQVKCLLNVIENCIKFNAYFVFSPPDTIFGNNSLSNALKSISDKEVCFASPVARVSSSKIECYKDIKELSTLKRNLSNSQLVSCLFDCLHPEIINAFDNKDLNSTFWTGKSIRRLNEKSYLVIDNIPTIFLGKFNFFDHLFFNFYNSFNHWDRKWSSILLRSNRLKISGSSDMFFCVEITKDLDKQAKLHSGMLNNDLKNKGLKLEHLIPNQFIHLWKTE